MNKFKRFVSLVLVLCMVMAFVPAGISAASDDFLRVYHLDCGRKFFEIADVKELIDVLSASGYTHLELALGNDGLRLILDDMSVLTYGSEDVADGIKAGNAAYSHAGEWTQTEMDEILAYAKSKNIEIIPLINTPGHMDAILDAMESVGINGAYNGSARTVDVTNEAAVEFTQALVAKYVAYFAANGCTYFNMGADEYANDVYTSGAMGFGHLQSSGLYDEFAAYVNGVAAIIKDAGMTPIAFNDGLYFNNDSTVSFDTDIVAAYWTSGWGSYAVASAATLAAKGHKILNTNDGWYYVLGRDSGTYGYSSAANGVANTSVTTVSGGNVDVIGAMACLWCDEPGANYATYESDVHGLIKTLAENNSDYFVAETSEDLPVYDTEPVAETVPSNALTSNSVTLEYWITNLPVTCSNKTSASITTSTAGVTTEEGVDLTTIAGASGTWDYGNVVYWKSVRLDEANEQTTSGGDDETADGTVMTHVRYYNGAWQYKTTDGAWNYFLSSDQLVAYYLMPTTVTDQITTLTKDWGYVPSENTDGPEDGQVALSFAVVDGSTLTPSEEDIFSTSTTIFNFWSGRDIGVVAPLNNSNYEIYKITVTEGKRSSGTSGRYSPWKTGVPTWEKTTNDLGTGEWFDEREVWNISEGTDPMVNGQLDNIVWSAKDTAFLILFYVRAKNADLTVKYVDDSLAGATITERGVFADQDESFYDLEQTSAVPDADGAFTLDDNATLTYYNYETEKNVVQTFEKSLLNFQDIQPHYRSGAYKYVGAEIADDGKTLILHYNIDETVLDPRYVVDFGLPVSVELNKIIQNYGTDDITSVQMVNAAYGTAVIENSTLTYTPEAILQASAAVTLKVTYSDGEVVPFNVGFVPASTVYYEEGFADYTGSWTAGSTGSGEQTLQVSKDTAANYGYDAKYAAETGMSNGTEAVSSTSGDKAELTFTGTGIDVYANCGTDTSIMIAMLYDGDGKMVKMYQVDTKAKDGTTGATDNQAAESVSMPVVSIQGLTHGSYKLVLQHTKKADAAGSIRLDGFRVYNTLTAAASDSDYPTDEQAPSFLEVRNAVLAGLNVTVQTKSNLYTYVDTLMSQVYDNEQTLNGALVLGATGIDVKDLLENGPKNELFLWPGETLTFNLGGATAQIGLKAPMGETSYKINDELTGTIKTGTDLFYDNAEFTGTIVIKNTHESNVLSVTKLKLFGAENLTALTAEDVAYTLSVMGLVEGGEKLERPGAPMVNPFFDVAEDAWFFEAVMWAVKYGITTGISADQFGPNSACSRAEIVTFLWRANGAPEMDGAENPFVDLDETGYYYDAVLWAYENGITTGIDATHFGPTGKCTRAQVVTFLWRTKGCPDSDVENPFSDVVSDQWYTEAVLWAYENGITNGMDGDVYGVESICNRAQIVTFLYRLHKLG